MDQNDEKIVNIPINPDLFIKKISNSLYYSVQAAFQEKGVSFVDLNNGHIIYGQVNIDTIGMVLSLPKEKEVNTNTVASKFLIPPKKHKKVVDVEATLNIFEPSDPNEPIIFTIQVVNENNLDDWIEVIQEVGCKYVYLDDFENKVCEILFRVVGLANPDPDDPTDSAVNTMLGNIQRYRANQGQNSDLISGFYIYPDFYEDDTDQKSNSVVK